MSTAAYPAPATSRVRSLLVRLPESAPFGLLTCVVLLLTAIPYAFAYRSTPDGWHFMGILLNVPDTAQYLSWARESSHSILIQDKLTSEPGLAVYYNLFFLVVGRLATALDIGYAEALQLARLGAGATYIGAIFWFAGLAFADRRARWTATLVGILGAGLGWVWVVTKVITHSADIAFPIDVYTSEPNTFLSVLAFPLQAMAGGLVVVVLGLSAIAFERNSFRLAALAGGVALVLALQHTYDLLVVYSVVACLSLWAWGRAIWTHKRLGGWRPLLLGACICAWSGPAALWSFAITRFDPIWHATLGQYGNAGIYTPSVPHLFILMGIPLAITTVGLLVNAGRLPRRDLLIRLGTMKPIDVVVVSWAVAGVLLVYIPTDFQIKMFVSWQVPLAILATRYLSQVVSALFARRGPGIVHRALTVTAVLFVLASLPTNAYLLGWRIADLNRHAYPYYLPSDDYAALSWLNAHTHPDEPVLSSLTIGQYVPSQSGNSAFLGHWAATVDFFSKERAVATFFSDQTPDSWRHEVLDRYGIRYVYVGLPERQLGTYNPNETSFLHRVYANSTVTIFSVEPTSRADDPASHTSI